MSKAQARAGRKSASRLFQIGREWWRASWPFWLMIYAAVALFQGGYLPVQPGLDPSWGYAVNYLPGSGVLFGRDVYFTYGPLGYVYRPMPVGSSLLHATVLRVLLHLLLTGVLLAYLRGIKDRSAVAFFVPCFVVALSVCSYEYWQVLTLCLLVGLAFRGGNWAWWALSAGAVLAGGLLYAKFNLGIAAILILGLAGLVLAVRQGAWRPAAASWAVCLLTVVVLAHWLLGSVTHLPLWLKGAVEIAQGYSAAMSFEGSPPHLGRALVGCGGYALLAGLLLWRRSPAGWLALIVSPLVFISFKHGFVRSDIGHVLSLFTILMALVSVLLLSAERRRDWVLCLGGFAFVWLLALPAVGESETQWGAKLRGIALLKGARDGLRPVFDLSNLRAELERQGEAALRGDALPAKWLAELGDGAKTVDVVPWEIAYCPANGLRWSPMPVLQTYSAYTKWLDERNARHFIHERVPDYVIVNYAAIDGRDPLWEAPVTWRAIFTHYEVRRADLEQNILLLRRRRDPVEGAPQTVARAQFTAGEWVSVPPSDTPLYARIEMPLTWRGKLWRTLYRVPPVNIEVVYESGRRNTRRVIPDVAGNGLLMNALPIWVNELADLFACRSRDRVRQFRLLGDGAAFLRLSLEVTWESYPAPCARVVSVADRPAE